MSIVLQDTYNPNEDPSLLSTWSHRAWVTTGCITVAISLMKSIIGAAKSQMLIEPILAGFAGYIMADLATGVYHWAIDNYGNASTPIFGYQIIEFQGHHKWPWVLSQGRQFANKISTLSQAITLTFFPIVVFYHGCIVLGFVATFSGCIMFSQQFHEWAHRTKKDLPKVVVTLQDAGLLVSRSEHAVHHKPPYNRNYCIVSGLWNNLLDQMKVFLMLEMFIFSVFEVRPRSWADPDPSVDSN